jgi:hypothetical protein
MNKPNFPVVIAITSDLFFGMRIKNTIQQLGGKLTWIDKNEMDDGQGTFLEMLKKIMPTKILLDLESKVNWEEWLRDAKSDDQLQNIKWVGYGSHVDIELLEKAKELGVDQVMARSQFTKKLVEIIQGT